MRYRGYIGTIQRNPVRDVYYGKVKYINDIIYYESSNLLDMESRFKKAVDDYIANCEEMGETPETPRIY
jgi:predicted HicB family RNase H-like nuclease